VLELNTILWAQGPENLTLRMSGEKSPFDTFANGPHIQARKRMEQILGPESLKSAGSIGPWEDHLVSTALGQTERITTSEVKKSSYVDLVGYSGLQTEVRRFAEWAKQSGYSTELLDAVLEIQEKIVVQEKRDKQISAETSIAEKMEIVEKGEVATVSVGDISTEPVAPEILGSVSESRKSRRKTGWILAISGLLILLVSLCIFAPIVVQLSNPADASDSIGEIITPIILCSLPVLLIGLALLLGGIFILRRQQKQPVATPNDSRLEGRDRGSRSRDPKELFRDGLGLFKQERFREAVPILELVTSLDPTFAPAQFTLGGAYLRIAEGYHDEDAVRPWANKSANAFREAIDLANRYGGLNDRQLDLARNAVIKFDLAEQSHKMKRETLSLPEGRRIQIYADFMETKDSEFLLGTNLNDFTALSRRGELAQMARSLENNAAKAEEAAIAKITGKYGITKEQLIAIAQEGEEKKWPFESITE
jgi:hypothetical protein